MRFIPIISLSILILLLTACSADTGSSVNASANLSQDQPHQDIPALPLTDSGLSMLLHIGIDTVNLEGKGFTCFVENGQSVKKGDKLLEIDIDYLTANAPSLCSPILCTELEDNQKVRLLAEGEVKAGDPLFAVDVYEEEA